MSLFTARTTHAGARHRAGLLTVAAIVGATALLAGCSDSSDGNESTDAPSSTAAETAAGMSSTVQVIDQTNLLLVTAQETLEARGLVVEVVDATGQGRTVEDPAEWVVVSQTPDSGTVDAGSTVTLEARQKTDPIS